MFGRSMSFDTESKYGFVSAYLGAFPAFSTSEEERAEAEKERWTDTSPVLYHYTSPNGLIGIVNSGGFWASDNRFMNDSEELVHGIEFATDLISRNIKTSSLPEFTNVLQIAHDALRASYASGQLVACFSLKCDSLEQWRGYGRSGGVCIELSTTQTDCVPLFRTIGLTRQRVFYEKKDKEAFVLLKIRRFLEAFINDSSKFGKLSPDVQDSYGQYLAKSMANAIAGFKNSAFLSEAEVRIVCPFEIGRNFAGGLQFRESEYGPIAYVNTANFVQPPGLLSSIFALTAPSEETSPLLPITSVTVGPSARQPLIVESIKTFMQERGYAAVTVKPSNVPFRGF